MGTILEIAQDVADDLSISRPLSLFGLDDEGDTSPRRLARAITKACQYLRDSYDWQQSKREHRFMTIAGSQQTRAIPADFQSFVPDTMFDRTRRLPLEMAETDANWAILNGMPVPTYPIRWVRRANDLWFTPGMTAGNLIAYEYISAAIGEDPYKPHTVVYSTDGMTLPVNGRVVVRSGHTIIVPSLGPSDHIELVPEGGLWGTLGAVFTTADGAAIANQCPTDYKDWLTITRQLADYVMRPVAGHWTNIAIPTTNGMMLEAGRRYLVGQGQIVYVPVLTSGEWIELVAGSGSWYSNNSRFVTRTGQEIQPPLTDIVMATLTADMSIVPAFTLSEGVTTADPYGMTRPITRFTADTQVPLWPDILVSLGALWQMQARDGQAYGQDFLNFERAVYDHLKTDGTGRIGMDPGMERGRRPRKYGIAVLDDPQWTEVH